MDPTEYIQVAGKSSIYLGVPADRDVDGNYATMMKIGEQMNETQISVQHYTHEVPGDRYGGPQGPPIEMQMLGSVAQATFQLSRWNQGARRFLQKHNVYALDGTIAESEIGSLMLRDRAFRLLIVPSKTNTIPGGIDHAGGDYFAYNFPCAILSSPVEVGQGTKFSILQFSMTAHRAPDGHPNEGVLYDRNETLPT